MAKLTREEALALTRGEKPKGYQFIDQPPMDTPQNTAAGTKIHEQMEAYIKGPQHTPTPWNLENHNEIVAQDGHESLIAEVYDGMEDQWKANARFIVKAANSHDRLVEALKAVREAYMEIAEPNAHGRSCATCDLLAEIEG